MKQLAFGKMVNSYYVNPKLPFDSKRNKNIQIRYDLKMQKWKWRLSFFKYKYNHVEPPNNVTCWAYYDAYILNT